MMAAIFAVAGRKWEVAMKPSMTVPAVQKIENRLAG